MAFEIKPDTPQTPSAWDPNIIIVSGPGGSPWVTDPKNPHLGGNFDGGDLGSMYPNDIWPWLIDYFHPKTMADIGCGTGETAHWFAEHGVKAMGVDGLPYNVKKCKQPTLLHDLEKQGPCVFPLVDLIWCADVAEHIAEEHVESLLATLAQCQVLAMCQGTDAHPGGWHHVNNKPEQYWVDALARHGMIELKEATAHSHTLTKVGWWDVSGRIYGRKA